MNPQVETALTCLALEVPEAVHASVVRLIRTEIERLEKFEGFVKLAARWHCQNENSAGVCSKEYPEEQDEWCLSCLAKKLIEGEQQ